MLAFHYDFKSALVYVAFIEISTTIRNYALSVRIFLCYTTLYYRNKKLHKLCTDII